MLVTREELLKIPLGSANTVLSRVRVDYRRKSIAALGVKGSGLLSREKILPYDKIVQIDRQKITLPKGDHLVKKGDYADPQRYGELIKKTVYTEKKKYLGMVATYKIDTDTGKIVTIWVKTPLHLRGLWKNVLLINRSAVLDVQRSKIIVADDIVKDLARDSTNQTLSKLYNFGQAEPELTSNSSSIRALDAEHNE